jgi:hypothetical protein
MCQFFWWWNDNWHWAQKENPWNLIIGLLSIGELNLSSGFLKFNGFDMAFKFLKSNGLTISETCLWSFSKSYYGKNPQTTVNQNQKKRK